MKKLIIAIAILALFAGSAFAAALDDGMTRQVWAQSKGRAVVSDGSVVFRVWYAGSGAAPAVGVSSDSVLMLYTDVTAATYDSCDTSSASYNTIGEVVDYVNSLDGWHAEAGPDGYRAFDLGQNLLCANYAAAGANEPNANEVKLDTGTAKTIMCGVNPDASKVSRIKQIYARGGGSGLVTMSVYDGDTAVWSRYVKDENWNSSTAFGSSADTVTFTTTGDKGISAGTGKNLVVSVSRATTLGDALNKLNDTNISIVYDQF